MSPDLMVAAGQVILALLAWLMLLEPDTYIRPRIALLTVGALGLVAAGLFRLSAPLSGTVVIACACAWWGIFTFRGTQHGLR